MNSYYFLLLTVTVAYYINNNFTNIIEQVFGKDLINQFKIAVSDTEHTFHMQGYPIEKHEVFTADGYVITIYRMLNLQSSNYSSPVLLFSGLSSSSQVFGLFNNSLAFRLYDEGYDVWLGNFRSVMMECRHITYSQLNYRYWDFSLEEMANYDLPSIIDYVLNFTKYSQLSLVTFSLSTTLTAILESTKLEYNEKIKRNVALAPGLSARYATSITFQLSGRYSKEIKLIYNAVKGIHVVNLATVKLLFYLFPFVCLTSLKSACSYFVIRTTGYNPQGYEDNLSLVAASMVKGTSFKTLIQLLDAMTTDGRLRQFNYGTDENLKRYGTEIPPAYNWSLITSPTTFVYGAGDVIATCLTLENALLEMKSPVRKILMKTDTFTHMDFLCAIRELDNLNDLTLAELI